MGFLVLVLKVDVSVSKHDLEVSFVFTSLISHVPLASWQPSGGCITPASIPYLNESLKLHTLSNQRNGTYPQQSNPSVLHSQSKQMGYG